MLDNLQFVLGFPADHCGFILPSRHQSVKFRLAGFNRTVVAWCALAWLSIGAFNAVGQAVNATPEELFKAGSAAFEAGNFDVATKNFEAILAAGPTGESLETILFTLASTYLSQKKFPKAEEYYNRTLKEFPEGKNTIKALISIAQIQTQTGRKEDAAKTLQKAAEGKGDLAAKARIAQASMLTDAGKFSAAVSTLRPMIAGGIKNDLSVQAAVAIVENESKQGHFEEALTLLEQLQSVSNLIDNPLQLDLLAVQIGDGLLAKEQYRKSLEMYAIVRPKQVVFNLQKQHIAGIEKKITDNKASLQTHPNLLMEVNSVNVGLLENVKHLKDVLDQFEKLPDTEVPVRLRQARAYDGLDQKWESLLIWESLAEASKDPAIHEDALFSIASVYCSLGRADDAEPALDRYLAEFPNGKYASQAGYLKGALALEAGNFSKAETLFGSRIDKGDTSALASDMQFLRANSAFAQGAVQGGLPEHYKRAIENYKKYLSQFPGGKFAEESTYRISLASFQLGDYGPALDGFEAYIKKYPTGDFVGDCGYRIALCYKAAEKYDEVLKRCADWLTKHEGEVMYAEVLALQGDAYAAKEMSDEAADSYSRSVTMGSSDELLKYSLFEANKQYQKKERWKEIEVMFTKFAEKHPEHPAAISAVYWVSKARIKLGRSAEAKQYLAQSILKNINDRRKDAVEQLLSQLAQICAKRPRIPLVSRVASNAETNPIESQTSAESSEPTPTPRPSPTPPPPYDAEADFAKYLDAQKVGTAQLARARLVYAKAELAGFSKNPDHQKELMASIYRQIPAAQLSALLLAECGEIALEKGEVDKAEAFYKELLTSFPKSDLLEYAYYGMGAVALARTKPDDAIRYFNDAVEKASAEAKLADITYGTGCAFLMQSKFDDAKKIFEQVVSTKEWRGEVTARAMLSLGDLEEKRGNTTAAIQYYQHVFVAYQRYPAVVVPAYLKTADGFIKLGEPAKAAAHLREMLSKPRLAESPLADQARVKLETLPSVSAAQPNSPTAKP